MTGPNQNSDRRPVIGHFFADCGVESEVLSTFGHVVRVTIDPRPNPFVAETYRLDLMEECPRGSFDLVLLHPRCTDRSEMTSIDGDPEEYPNQIPRAREIAERVADDYIIENKPRDDLRNPTILNGRMYGLPIKYERAFETTFAVRNPPRERELPGKTVSPYFYSDRDHDWWLSTKGYRHRWPKQHLAKNALPSAYLQTLVRSWLESRGGRNTEEVQDNNSPAPRRRSSEQVELSEVVR